MTQQRPSDPSDRHVEYVSGDPAPEDDAPAREAAVEQEQEAHHGVPYQQSRPGPDDDILLATGRPRRPTSTREGETFVQSERRQLEIGRASCRERV